MKIVKVRVHSELPPTPRIGGLEDSRCIERPHARKSFIYHFSSRATVLYIIMAHPEFLR